MTLKGKSVLVTGGAGFIGSHLVDRIIEEEPSSLVVVDNLYMGKVLNLQEAMRSFPRLRIRAVDASREGSMGLLVKLEDVEVIFNLAIVSLPASLIKPRWAYQHNVDITLCACELARKGYYKTLIHFSSSEAYGTCQDAPMSEAHPLNPTTPYGASKAATDHLVLSYCKSYGIDASIIRPFNNYGPRQNEGEHAGVIPLTIRRMLSDEAPIIYGDGKQTRDYIYVTETADAAIEIYNCEDTRGRVLNIASGNEISINELVELIAKHSGGDRDTIYQDERQGDVRRFVGDIGLARDMIGFEPIVGFREGIVETVEWYRRGTGNE